VAGRFPLYTDADVNGPVVQALVDHNWEVLRAIDAFPEGTDDKVHFAHAARENRVMVANDIDVKLLAERWYAEQRAFRGLHLVGARALRADEGWTRSLPRASLSLDVRALHRPNEP